MNAKNNNEKDRIETSQDGLRLHDFSQIFNGHRPKIFCMLVNLLTGLKNEDFEWFQNFAWYKFDLLFVNE